MMCIVHSSHLGLTIGHHIKSRMNIMVKYFRAIRLFVAIVFREIESKDCGIPDPCRITGHIMPPLAWDIAYQIHLAPKSKTNWIQEMRDYYMAGGQEDQRFAGTESDY